MGMLTAVMNMIFLLHVEARQLPDVVKWVMLGIQRSSGMWSFGAGDGNLLSRVCFWCQVGLEYIRKLYKCGSSGTAEIYTCGCNKVQWIERPIICSLFGKKV